MSDNSGKEHPLIEAIDLKDKAIREGAHPKVVERLERIINERALHARQILSRSETGRKILESADNGTELEI